MDTKTFARIGAVIFVAFAITATAIEASRKDAPPLYRSLAVATEMPVDPLKVELRRCQRLGEAGTRDTGCLKTWAENRERFLQPTQPVPQQLAPQPPGPPSTVKPQDQSQPQPADDAPAPAAESHTNEAR